jgi:hypothetical protein
VVSIVLGLLSLGFVIPKVGRNLFTEIAGTGAFWKIGILLVLAGLTALGLDLLIRKPRG